MHISSFLVVIFYHRPLLGAQKAPEMPCIVLYCIVLYCIVLYCVVLHCIVLYCVLLYCIVLYCIVLYCIVLYCIVLEHAGGGAMSRTLNFIPLTGFYSDITTGVDLV